MAKPDLELNIFSALPALSEQLKKLETKTLADIESRAMKHASEYTASMIRRDGHRELDKPIPAIFDNRRGRQKRGWIFWQWDKPAFIRKSKTAKAFVEIQGHGGNSNDRAAQVESLRRQIYGDTSKDRVTPEVPYIITPSQTLRNSRTGAKPPYPFFKLDKHGNIKNYRGTMRRAMADKNKRFLHIPIGQVGGGKGDNGLSLPPGLYFLDKKKRKYKRNRHTRRRGGPYNVKSGPDRKLEVRAIHTVLTYTDLRTYKKRWEFKERGIKYMERAYTDQFRLLLQRELKRISKATLKRDLVIR